jgi:hypothetical protein
MFTSQLRTRTRRLALVFVVVALTSAVWVSSALAGGGLWSG